MGRIATFCLIGVLVVASLGAAGWIMSRNNLTVMNDVKAGEPIKIANGYKNPVTANISIDGVPKGVCYLAPGVTLCPFLLPQTPGDHMVTADYDGKIVSNTINVASVDHINRALESLDNMTDTAGDSYGFTVASIRNLGFALVLGIVTVIAIVAFTVRKAKGSLVTVTDLNAGISYKMAAGTMDGSDKAFSPIKASVEIGKQIADREIGPYRQLTE